MDEFLEVRCRGAIREKIREGVAQGGCDDSLGGDDAFADGAQPGHERGPDELGDGCGEGEHDALGNQPELDEAVVGGEFPAHGVAIGPGLVVEVLVPAGAIVLALTPTTSWEPHI